MNYYYRPLDGAWYAFRDAADDSQRVLSVAYPDPLASHAAEARAPDTRPDAAGARVAFLYNGAYLETHCCNGSTQRHLPLELQGDNVSTSGSCPRRT